MATDPAHKATARELDANFDALLMLLVTLPAALILRLVVAWVARLAGVEAEALAGSVAADGDTRAARQMMDGDATTSRREKYKKARRAKAAAQNPELSKKMQQGELSAEQMDNIADAANQNPNAATDAKLIADVARANPDQGKKIAKKWVSDRQKTDDINKEHERQRALRAVRKGFDPDKRLHTITFEGDKASIGQMWSILDDRSDQLYQQAGGRDLHVSKHPRSFVQRLFDGAHQILTGLDSNGQPLGGCTCDTCDGGGSASTGSKPGNCVGAATNRGRGPSRSGRGRPAAVISIPFGRLIGANPDAPIFQPGQGPIPDEVALQLLSNCELFVQVVSDTGITAQPLWLGRRKRNATINQYIALAVRDGGCVMCTAPPERCHSHHLMPWHAPGKGETNIDELVLLCPSCHVSLHERKLTLYRDEKSGQWATRPATKNETPPAPRPHASLGHRRPGRSSGRHEERGRSRSAPP